MGNNYISAELRRIVYGRAEGCCEYCLIPESVSLATHQIDHIIAQKHQGKTTLNNLALCCTICNKYKGSDIASIASETGEITALLPSTQRSLDRTFYYIRSTHYATYSKR